MMLLPKLAKQREFGPCEHFFFPVPVSHREKNRSVGEAQEKFFLQQQLDQFLDFPQIIFS
jgi:hypothetical protein